ncbi:MAG: type II toxin-antitoxin system VapC family toxin, partial [Thermomicrobiales bacterium]|nr:type II toxin-antitoxin system VapC family toxin [Thermomicrobiales bacterium]
DTDWAIQAIGGREPAVHTLGLLADSKIYISYMTLGELYEGAFHTSNPPAELVILRRFTAQFRLLGFTEPIIETFAEIRAYLRRRGLLIADMDLLIAATALYHNLTLLTFNRRHFDRIPDLKLYQPA